MITTATGVTFLRNISCTNLDGHALCLHLLLPEPLPLVPMPTIVWLGAGADRTGSTQRGIGRLLPLVERGYCGVAIEARGSSAAPFPAPLHDCKTAIRFLRKYSANFRLDVSRIGVWGESSGGTLAALLGVTAAVPYLEGEGGWPAYSSSVQAVCDFYGPIDFVQLDRAGSSIVLTSATVSDSLTFGGPIQDHPALAARANPISYLSPARRYPPFLLVHGENDPLVPIQQSALLEAALRRVGAEVQLQALAGAGHGGVQFESEATTRRVGEFFDRHLQARVPV